MKNKIVSLIAFLLCILTNTFSQTPGNVDTSFNFVNTGLLSTTKLYDIYIQQDGKIVVGGKFSQLDGLPSKGLMRLQKNGSIDNTFNIGGGTNGDVNSVLNFNNKILVSGNFSSINGVVCKNTILLKLDGSIDTSFYLDPLLDGIVGDFILVDSSTNSIICHKFDSVHTLIKISSNGNLDTTFISPILDGIIGAIIHKSKIITYGTFGIKKLNLLSGDIDTTISLPTIYTLGVQSDNKIIIGSQQLFSNGFYLDRINQDGSFDASFVGNFIFAVKKIKIDNNDKIIVGGYRKLVTRLNSDGSLDNSFNVSTSSVANEYINTIQIQSDGNIIVGGYFSNIIGINNQEFITRLNGDKFLHANLCYVTIDTATQKSKIYWAKESGLGIAYYIIYKEATANVYDSIGVLQFNDPYDRYIDYSSDPSAYVHRYRVAAVDSLGNKSSLSTINGTIRVRNLSGTQGQIFLDWNQPDGLLNIPSYTIYEVTTSGLSFVATIPSTNLQYTINNPPTSTTQYLVGIDGVDNCGTVGKNRSTGITVFSNPVSETTTGIRSADSFQDDIKTTPNPFNDKIDISIIDGVNKQSEKQSTIQKIEIFNTIGKRIDCIILNTNSHFKYSISTENYNNGIYIVKTTTNNNIEVVKKMVKVD